MSLVGAFPGIGARRRKTIKAPPNPLDISTVFSIFPKEINEHKVTISPGFFHIDKGHFEQPARLVVGASSWWKETSEEEPLLEIPNSSVQVAEAICRDYSSGLLGVTMPNIVPGIFWIAGNISLKELREKHPERLQKAQDAQQKWFLELIRLADALWSRTNGNPITISDEMRLAAREMKQTDRDWMRNHVMVAQTACLACGQPRNPLYPVCPHCKAIADPARAKELNIKFAE